jgi:hypothetical protein
VLVVTAQRKIVTPYCVSKQKEYSSQKAFRSSWAFQITGILVLKSSLFNGACSSRAAQVLVQPLWLRSWTARRHNMLRSHHIEKVWIKNTDPNKIRLHFILYWKIFLSKAFLKNGRSLFYSLCKMYRSNWFTSTAQIPGTQSNLNLSSTVRCT